MEAPDAAFDRFFSCYVLDLLSAEDIQALLEEAHRILAPGGLLCLAGLTEGDRGLSRGISWLWRRLHHLRPAWLGGCRPLVLLRFLSSRDWRVTHHEVVTAWGIASEVVVAERTG